MIPVIQTLSAMQGIDLSTLAWTLSMGTDIGGSATPIGASANVVGISVATKQGYPIGWGYYCKYAAPATIIVISISIFLKAESCFAGGSFLPAENGILRNEKYKG